MKKKDEIPHFKLSKNIKSVNKNWAHQKYPIINKEVILFANSITLLRIYGNLVYTYLKLPKYF